MELYWTFDEIARLFSKADKGKLLLQGTWGIEKESQRVSHSGDLALTDHPVVFGDKLRHPTITTDFAESQLELITPPLHSIEEAFRSLGEIHDEVEAGIGDELLWPLSMPPRLPDEALIRIAKFNDTKEGRDKEAYRYSLAERYGKKMQMISGLHVNFSFQEDLLQYIVDSFPRAGSRREVTNYLYFAMARNYLRYRWLLVYLFGASPSIDPTYASVICDELNVIERCCPSCCSIEKDYERYATSLRVSRFGYSNTDQRKYNVSFNGMDEYIATFRSLLEAGVLQKESELYSSIRLKQTPNPGESTLNAMEQRGVQYAEIRILDLNPFERNGISLQQLYFVHVFMLYCLFEASPPITSRELEKINENHHKVSLFGRKPRLKLYMYPRGQMNLLHWGEQLFAKMMQVASLLDQSAENFNYSTAVRAELAKLHHLELLPSAMIQREMRENGLNYIDYGIRRAKLNQHNALIRG
jgi:glutamate--cysteine ligase